MMESVTAGKGYYSFKRGSDLKNFYLNKFPLDNSKKFFSMEAILPTHDIPTFYLNLYIYCACNTAREFG